jgi:hypothetical protein
MMGNPRRINRCFYGLFIGTLLVSVLVAILTHDSQPLLWGLAVLLGFMLLCGVAALVNLAIFPPIFRLLARLTGRQGATHSESRDDHVAQPGAADRR